MKHILVPVDFSIDAANAAQYAAELAKQVGAEITLLYVFHLPIPVSEVPYPVDFSRLEDENKDLLDSLALKIEQKQGIRVHMESAAGFAVDEILDMALEPQFDLIVLGMRGAGGKLSALLGSTATEVLRKSLLPVLAIPRNAQFKAPVQILLACDFQQVRHPEIFKALIGLTRRFHSEISLLNVIKPGELPERQKAMEGIRMERFLDGLNYKFDFEEEENVEIGVDNYLCRHPSDMLVIVPHEHTFLDRLFLRTHSKRLMLHATIPVLALPDYTRSPVLKKPEMGNS
jgi:nucleotide-binding universal stress UspA family protein